MSASSFRLRIATRGAALATFLVVGCASSGGIEGKYYNSRSGEFAMELKGGKALRVQGLEDREMTYEVKGDSLIISDPAAGPDERLAFAIESDGTLSLGLFGSLTKKRPE
jgi:hypothetical protein